VEETFLRDVGSYTPPTSPAQASSSSPPATSSRFSSPSPLPLSVPCVPMVRRSTRHAVAEDRSSTTDKDTFAEGNAA
jgi:hypothetical protein